MHIILVFLLPIEEVASNDNSFIYNLLEGIQIPVPFICEWCCFPYYFAVYVYSNRCISNGRAGSHAQRDCLLHWPTCLADHVTVCTLGISMCWRRYVTILFL